MRRALRDQEGSVLPLTIGYAVLALLLVFVCVNATSLYIEQKRLDALADGAALAAADGFVFTVNDGEPRADLTDDGVRAQAEDFVSAVDADATLVSAESPDGVSARVTVSGVWHPPLVSVFVPAGVTLTATATSRNALL
jgi:uncharacterized membrane protein